MTGTEGSLSDWDDAGWLLASAFIIFTMQSGFGMLESGLVSKKNEVNIMVKNTVDVLFGGISFWMFGYAIAFGVAERNTPFCGFGQFFVDGNVTTSGWLYTNFFFQLSFSTTSTTIVSGAMAERTKLDSYCVFSFLNTLIYAFPAHWIWDRQGWLRQMGVVDAAGGCAVHIVGGFTGLIATLILRPRLGRFSPGYQPEMSSPTNAIVGMFMLWWGWLGFNCGSTLGVTGHLWKLSARAAVTTMMSSTGGGLYAIIYSYIAFKKKIKINHMINGILGALVAITPGCMTVDAWASIIIGIIGAACSCHGATLLSRIRIDDPVDCVATHGFCGIWGMIAVGVFSQKEITGEFSTRDGLFYGGGMYLLGIQLLAILCVTIWTLVTSFIVIISIKFTMGIRLTEAEEQLGADAVEHAFDTDDIIIKSRLANISLSELTRSRVNSREYQDNVSLFNQDNSFHISSRPASGIVTVIKSPRRNIITPVTTIPHIGYSDCSNDKVSQDEKRLSAANSNNGNNHKPHPDSMISTPPRDDDELSLRSVISACDKLEKLQRAKVGLIHKGR